MILRGSDYGPSLNSRVSGDTQSIKYDIAGNVFYGNRAALRIAQTTDLKLTGNKFIKIDSTTVLVDSSRVVDTANETYALYRGTGQRAAASPVPTWHAPSNVILPKRLSGGLDPATDRMADADRSSIIVDEWGPYDYRSPKLWPRDTSYATPLALRVLGPAGKWRLTATPGVDHVSKVEGKVGDTIVVTPAAGLENDWKITLEYRGASTTSPRGVKKPAGTPYTFSYSRFNPVKSWNVSFFALADHDNRDAATRLRLVSANDRKRPPGELSPHRNHRRKARPGQIHTSHNQRRRDTRVGRRLSGDRQLEAARIGDRHCEDLTRRTPPARRVLPGRRLGRGSRRDSPRQLTIGSAEHVQVASYHETSGVECFEQGIGPSGSRRRRTLMIQNEHLRLRHVRYSSETLNRRVKLAKVRCCGRVGYRAAFVDENVSAAALPRDSFAGRCIAGQNDHLVRRLNAISECVLPCPVFHRKRRHADEPVVIHDPGVDFVSANYGRTAVGLLSAGSRPDLDVFLVRLENVARHRAQARRPIQIERT